MLKITVAGPAGTGKTTLASRLVDVCSGAQFVREAARDLGDLGLALSEHSSGPELAAIALRQKVSEDSVASHDFVSDRGAIDILAFAYELQARPGVNPLDAEIADTVHVFASDWLRTAEYTLVVYCVHPFVMRPIETEFQQRLAGGYDRALATCPFPVVRLVSRGDYDKVVSELGGRAAAAAERQ